MPLVKFMSSAAGRALRFIMGLGLFVWAMLSLSGVAFAGVAGFGVVAMLAGIFNFCLLAPLFGAKFFASKTPA